MSGERSDGSSASAPLGVFDSGIGGLTVLQALRRRLPAEKTLYLGDTARVPYGPKSPETVRRYAAEAAGFLVARGVKAVVVACNTASARALPDLRRRLPVPVIGVVEPGARTAAERSRSGRIGVIGTRGTVESAAYQAAIRRYRPDAQVFGRACGLFVSLAEEGWTSGDVARLTAEHYLRPLLEREIDTLVLGCTHYPLLRGLIAEVAGAGVELVEPARATAAAVERRLDEEGLLRAGGEGGGSRYFVTDDAARFRELAGRWMEEGVDQLEEVSLPVVSSTPAAAPRRA